MLINSSNRIGLSGQVGKTNNILAKVMERLSTGRRINRASDDAAGLAIAEQLMTQVRGFEMATNNVDYATAAMHIGEGASNEISSMLQRQRELAIQASNDTLNNDQRAALNNEYQQLSQEITRTADSAQFNRQGTASGADIASGNAEVLVGANPGDEVTLPAADFRAATIGVAGSDISSAANARNAIGSVDTAIGNVSATRAQMGSMLNRLEHTRNNLVNQTANTQSAESMIRDMDFAMGAADMVRSSILNQAAIKGLGDFNQVSTQNMLSLLMQ